MIFWFLLFFPPSEKKSPSYLFITNFLLIISSARVSFCDWDSVHSEDFLLNLVLVMCILI